MDDVKHKKTNLMTFRMNPQESGLWINLKKMWNLEKDADVIHRIMGTFQGHYEERSKIVQNIRDLIKTWQIQNWEIYGK